MSEKSVAQKLGLKAGRTLLVRDAPSPIAPMLGALPDGAAIVEDGEGPFAAILQFAENRAALVERLPACKQRLEAGGLLWVAYAKGTSRLASDINRDSIRDHALTTGLDTV